MVQPYIDIYVSGPVQGDLEAFAEQYENHIPPQPGRPAVAAGTDEYGHVTEAVAAAGDPSLYYTCIRTTAGISSAITAPMSVVDAETGRAVVGMFA